MKLRTQLIVAFLLVSVVPLTAVILYSYLTSERAFRKAVEAEAGVLAEEMGKRMEAVTGELRRRIDRLASLPFRKMMAKNRRDSDLEVDPQLGQLLAGMGEAAGLVESLEFIPAQPPPPAPGSPHAPPSPVTSSSASSEAPAGIVIHLSQLFKRFGAEAPEAAGENPPPTSRFPDRSPFQPPPGIAAGRSESRILDREAEKSRLQANAEAGGLADQFLEKKAEALGKMIPWWTFVGEDERKALESRRQEMRLLFGREFGAVVRTEGEMAGTVRAQVSSQEVLRRVLLRTRRQQGEIPFALDAQGKAYTASRDDLPKLEALPLSAKNTGASRAQKADMTNWVVVTRKDPESGLSFGIARPIRDSLEDIRRTAVRNLVCGLGIVGLALFGILPLSARLTRNLTGLSEGAEELARGNLDARVAVRSRDEFGQLARTFNRMAQQLSENQQRLLEQERLRQELEMCRKIQEELLPREPLRSGFGEVQGTSIPAREVGGDFYNYFPMPNGDVALLVGDVSGKGIPAALLMANLQATLRARLPLETDLATLADRLDREIEASTPPELYLTLFMAILDPKRRTLRYVNAGHNTQFTLRENGALERLESTGRPLGLLSGYGYQERRIDLREGDSLFLYTDGLVETADEAGEEFGVKRLSEILIRERKAGMEELLAEVEQSVRNHRSNAEAADDATLLVLRVFEAQALEGQPEGCTPNLRRYGVQPSGCTESEQAKA